MHFFQNSIHASTYLRNLKKVKTTTHASNLKKKELGIRTNNSYNFLEKKIPFLRFTNLEFLLITTFFSLPAFLVATIFPTFWGIFLTLFAIGLPPFTVDTGCFFRDLEGLVLPFTISLAICGQIHTYKRTFPAWLYACAPEPIVIRRIINHNVISTPSINILL